MQYLLLVASIWLGTLNSIVTKGVRAEGLVRTMLVNVITFAIAFAAIFLMGLPNLKWNSELPWLLVVGNAASILFSQIALLKAIEYGGMALSTLFYSCGFVVSTTWGCIYYKEPVNAFHIIGFILVLVSLIMVVGKKEKGAFNLKWLLCALAGLVFSGTIGITQKLFTSGDAGDSLDLFLCAVFAAIVAISAVLCGLFWLLKKVKPGVRPETVAQGSAEEDAKNVSRRKVLTVICTVALGVILGVYNKLNTYLAGALPSILVFPILNGGVIAVTAAVSALLFKEKLRVLQIVGIAVCIAAIALIGYGQYIAG